jgi:hypothetical protein
MSPAAIEGARRPAGVLFPYQLGIREPWHRDVEIGLEHITPDMMTPVVVKCQLPIR